MAQVTSIPGIAGVSGAGASSPPAQQNFGQLNSMLLQIANMKKAGETQAKQAARQSVMDDLELAKQGFAIDPKKFEQNAKKAGMSIDLDALLAGNDPNVQAEIEAPPTTLGKAVPADPATQSPLQAVGN